MKLSTTIVPLILGLSITLGCEKPPQPQPKKPRVVMVQPAKQAPTTHLRTFSGVAHSASETKLSFKVGGTLSAVLVDVGDEVKAGQVLARVEPTDYALKREEAKAGKDQALAQLRNAQAQFERISNLYASDSASRQDLDSAELALSSAKANLSAADKRVDLSGAQVGYTVLKAQSTAKVAAVTADAGENVGVGQTVLVLNTSGEIEVEVAVPESVIVDVKQGAPASVRFQALPGEAFPAVVSSVGVASTKTATTYPVSVTLRGKTERVLAGMAAEVALSFPEEQTSRALLVPAKAIGEDQEGRFAWIAAPQEAGLAKAERRTVQTGALKGDELTVTSGISAGELLITAGLTYLEPEMQVRLPPTTNGVAGE